MAHVTTAHLLHLALVQWRHGYQHRYGTHWRIGRACMRRLAGPSASRGYITTILRFAEHHNIGPRHWRRLNQS